VLWNYDRRVVAVLAFFVLGTTGELSPLGHAGCGRWRCSLIVSLAAAGTDLGLYLHTVFKSSDQLFQEGTGVKEGDARATIMIGSTLATNLLSTILIGIQAWWVIDFKHESLPFFFLFSMREHRRKRGVLLNYLSSSSAAIKFEKVVAMLVESGFVYCCIWVRPLFAVFFFLNFSETHPWADKQVLYLISTYRILPDPWFAVMNASLVYFSVRSTPLHPTRKSILIFYFFFSDPSTTWTGPLPDDCYHLCRFTKISDVHNNEAAREHALFKSVFRSYTFHNRGDASTHVDTMLTTRGNSEYGLGLDSTTHPVVTAP